MTKPTNNLRDSLSWWLSKRKPFIINDEYKLELEFIDYKWYSAKIKITNLKDNSVSYAKMEGDNNE